MTSKTKNQKLKTSGDTERSQATLKTTSEKGKQQLRI